MAEGIQLSQDTILVRAGDLLESDLGEEKVMMSIERGRYYGLNEVGKLIHDHCDGKRSIAEIVQVLTQEFEVEAEECTRQVVQFCARLIQQQLLKVS